MTDNKLTPRVGDRVLFKLDGVTHVGNIRRDFATDSSYREHVEIDCGEIELTHVVRHQDNVTVVDRDPVE